MVRTGYEKIKLKVIIKSYILCKGKADAKELTCFINDNFKFRTAVTPNKIGALLKDNQQGILLGLQRETRYFTKDKRNRMVYYFEK